MAPEMEDILEPKTNRVDIWSLGCVLYGMVAGSLLFNNHREIWRYVDAASSPPPVVKDKGFSIACEDFLRDVLQPKPEDRPSAEDCLKKPWIMNNTPGSEYVIGSDLYKRLAKIERLAPDIDTFSDMVAYRAANNTPARSLATPVTDFTASTWRSASTFDSKIERAAPRLEPLAGAAVNPAVEAYDAPVREPPAWKLNYVVGSGSFGTVFLEKVQTRGMVSPELWAVKRLSRTVPNFPAKQYQHEVKNLQALSNVSFVQTYYGRSI